MKTITHSNNEYPEFQSTGNAARFAIPFAREVCIGKGYDIGCNRPEWAFPGATLIDPTLNEFHANNLPEGEVDYIFSSHCLEHVPHWVESLDYWATKIKTGGTLFLYLPHWDQTYWRPWRNRKHIHCFTPELLRGYFSESPQWKKTFVSERDLNFSFAIISERS